MQAKRKSLILVKRRIKFTKFSHYVTNPYRRHQLNYLYFVFFISDVAVFQVSKTKNNWIHDTQTDEIYLFLYI